MRVSRYASSSVSKSEKSIERSIPLHPPAFARVNILSSPYHESERVERSIGDKSITNESIMNYESVSFCDMRPYSMSVSFFSEKSKNSLSFLTSYPIFCESYTFLVDDTFYSGFIVTESRISTLELEKYYLSQASLSEPIEYDIVASLPGKYHIFGCIWEVWKGWEDLLIEFSEDLIARSFEDGFTEILMFEEREYTHQCHPEHESEECTDDECSEIHRNSAEKKYIVHSIVDFLCTQTLYLVLLFLLFP